MFERFTEEARGVVVLAQDEARELKHNYIGSEHLLLGLLRQTDSVAARALAELDISLEDARAQVVQVVGLGKEVAYGQIPFTPRAKRTLDFSLREALALGDSYIGPEHILRGLVLAQGLEIDPVDPESGTETIREGIARILSGPPDLPGTGISGRYEEVGRVRALRLHVRALRLISTSPATVVALVLVGIGVLIGWAIWGH